MLCTNALCPFHHIALIRLVGRCREGYQHGEKMEHDDYFWQNDFVWASDSHAGIGITEAAILEMAAER